MIISANGFQEYSYSCGCTGMEALPRLLLFINDKFTQSIYPKFSNGLQQSLALFFLAIFDEIAAPPGGHFGHCENCPKCAINIQISQNATQIHQHRTKVGYKSTGKDSRKISRKSNVEIGLLEVSYRPRLLLFCVPFQNQFRPSPSPINRKNHSSVSAKTNGRLNWFHLPLFNFKDNQR